MYDGFITFQESVRKAADLTLKTLSKVGVCCWFRSVFAGRALSLCVCAGVHTHV